MGKQRFLLRPPGAGSLPHQLSSEVPMGGGGGGVLTGGLRNQGPDSHQHLCVVTLGKLNVLRLN